MTKRKAGETKSVVRHVRLPLAVDKRLKKMAQNESRSISTFLKLIVTDFVRHGSGERT